MEDGQRLLGMFREEQKRRGNIGCMCNDCIEDMNNAYKKFKNNG